MLLQISIEFIVYLIISASLLTIIIFASNMMHDYIVENANNIEYALNGTIKNIKNT
ncbi:MAG: hypothetical protein ACP5RI_00245 [Candidatus Micrarchaeia archaeon]